MRKALAVQAKRLTIRSSHFHTVLLCFYISNVCDLQPLKLAITFKGFGAVGWHRHKDFVVITAGDHIREIFRVLGQP